ncbi:MAG: hypothetical protein NTX45_12840 [Proteobacteria bacterium]|nr:hypothetical protein [Pseudomonadota bacterium]
MKHLLSSLLLVLISTSIGFLALEGFTRWKFDAPWPERLPLVRVKPDPDTGWAMLPGDMHYTYDIQVKLNSHGFCGPEIQTKRKNEYRILALGDSHIYGQGLKEEELITTILNNSLNAPDLKCVFNTINMGVRAYSINSELALLRKFGIQLKPDHVILFFYINDFEKVHISQRYAKLSDKDWYMFDLSDKPTEEIVRDWNIIQLFRKSAFIMEVHDIYSATTNKEGIENQILQGVMSDKVENGIHHVKDSLDELIRLSKEYNFRVTLALIPASVQAMNEYPNQLYQSTLKQYAQQHSLDIIDLLPILSGYYKQNGYLPLIPYDGHYNREGHKAFGEAMVGHLHDLNINCNISE